MTWVDLVVLAFVLISGLLAFGRGLVREVLGIGAWVGAVAAAIVLMPSMRDTVGTYVHARQWVDPASFVIVFLVALAALMLIAHIVGRVVRTSALGGVDRTLGLLFGLARGAALVTVAYIIGGMLAPIDRWPAPVLESRSLTPTYEAAAWVRSQLPEAFRPARLEPPPAGRDATAEALFHATPQGRATGKASDHE
jgi:membrane protein required for colicin V production